MPMLQYEDENFSISSRNQRQRLLERHVEVNEATIVDELKDWPDPGYFHDPVNDDDDEDLVALKELENSEEFRGLV